MGRQLVYLIVITWSTFFSATAYASRLSSLPSQTCPLSTLSKELLPLPLGANQAAIYVDSTNGIDNATCGTVISPCLSLCQALRYLSGDENLSTIPPLFLAARSTFSGRDNLVSWLPDSLSQLQLHATSGWVQPHLECSSLTLMFSPQDHPTPCLGSDRTNFQFFVTEIFFSFQPSNQPQSVDIHPAFLLFPRGTITLNLTTFADSNLYLSNTAPSNHFYSMIVAQELILSHVLLSNLHFRCPLPTHYGSCFFFWAEYVHVNTLVISNNHFDGMIIFLSLASTTSPTSFFDDSITMNRNDMQRSSLLMVSAVKSSPTAPTSTMTLSITNLRSTSDSISYFVVADNITSGTFNVSHVVLTSTNQARGIAWLYVVDSLINFVDIQVITAQFNSLVFFHPNNNVIASQWILQNSQINSGFEDHLSYPELEGEPPVFSPIYRSLTFSEIHVLTRSSELLSLIRIQYLSGLTLDINQINVNASSYFTNLIVLNQQFDLYRPSTYALPCSISIQNLNFVMGVGNGDSVVLAILPDAFKAPSSLAIRNVLVTNYTHNNIVGGQLFGVQFWNTASTRSPDSSVDGISLSISDIVVTGGTNTRPFFSYIPADSLTHHTVPVFWLNLTGPYHVPLNISNVLIRNTVGYTSVFEIQSHSLSTQMTNLVTSENQFINAGIVFTGLQEEATYYIDDSSFDDPDLPNGTLINCQSSHSSVTVSFRNTSIILQNNTPPRFMTTESAELDIVPCQLSCFPSYLMCPVIDYIELTPVSSPKPSNHSQSLWWIWLIVSISLVAVAVLVALVIWWVRRRALQQHSSGVGYNPLDSEL